MLNLAHKKLQVYQSAMELLKTIYGITKRFPAEEQYLLIYQLRKSAISICSNLAEGAARSTRPEQRRFYEISRSSLVELDTQLEIAKALRYLEEEDVLNLTGHIVSIFRQLTGMIKRCQTS